MGSAGLTWFILSSILQSETTPHDKIKEESSGLVKAELEDNGSSSASVKIKKEEPESSALLQSYSPTGDDSGLGSAMESAEATGVQKRRSHSTEGDR